MLENFAAPGIGAGLVTNKLGPKNFNLPSKSTLEAAMKFAQGARLPMPANAAKALEQFAQQNPPASADGDSEVFRGRRRPGQKLWVAIARGGEISKASVRAVLDDEAGHAETLDEDINTTISGNNTGTLNSAWTAADGAKAEKSFAKYVKIVITTPRDANPATAGTISFSSYKDAAGVISNGTLHALARGAALTPNIRFAQTEPVTVIYARPAVARNDYDRVTGYSYSMSVLTDGTISAAADSMDVTTTGLASTASTAVIACVPGSPEWLEARELLG